MSSSSNVRLFLSGLLSALIAVAQSVAAREVDMPSAINVPPGVVNGFEGNAWSAEWLDSFCFKEDRCKDSRDPGYEFQNGSYAARISRTGDNIYAAFIKYYPKRVAGHSLAFYVVQVDCFNRKSAQSTVAYLYKYDPSLFDFNAPQKTQKNGLRTRDPRAKITRMLGAKWWVYIFEDRSPEWSTYVSEDQYGARRIKNICSRVPVSS